jgi:hypothetical protein
VVVLYHGSFRALARLDPNFDWDGELWETLTHELRHHLETLARDDTLEGVDYAMEEAFARARGEEFDPFYYQAGEEVAPGLFQVEYDFFLEMVREPGELEGESHLSFAWHGQPYRVPLPRALGDLHYLWVTGVDVGPGTLQLVLLRRRSWLEHLKGLTGGGEWEVLESTARARGEEG